MKPLEPRQIAARRVIQHLDLAKGKGIIQANGRRYTIAYDDLLDLVQAVEMIMLKVAGKVLQPHFRPVVRNRAALKIDALAGGDHSLYDGSQGPAPLEPWTPCSITEQMVKTHYLVVNIGGERWDNWFGRLDELVKCLYIVVREAQGDPYQPKQAIFLSQPESTRVLKAGHA